jgi:hypothetical protein
MSKGHEIISTLDGDGEFGPLPAALDFTTSERWQPKQVNNKKGKRKLQALQSPLRPGVLAVKTI